MGIVERRQREKEQRRNAIIDAAEKVFFSKGVETATMDEVAEEAELSKGTLYLYFKSKEDLYLAITKRGLVILTKMFESTLAKEKSGIEKIYGIGRAYEQFAKKYPDYFRAQAYYNVQVQDVTNESPNVRECEQQGEIALAQCAEAIRAGIEDRTIRQDLDPMKAAIVLWGQTTGILQLVSSKKSLLEKKTSQFGFKTCEDIIEYSFTLTRHSLE